MTYEEFIEGKERQRKAYLIQRELASVNETLKVLNESGLVVKVDVGSREYILTHDVERIFVKALTDRVDELEKEFEAL